jgi:thiamine-monophosphate kinase
VDERDLRVGDLTETELLGRIFPLLPAGAATVVGPGDDAAVVAAPDGRFVVSTDVLVEDRHFRRRWSTGEEVGRRAAAQNLADVAAMGARPSALVVSLVVPAELPVAWVTGLARGLAEGCSTVGAAVVGGDLSSGDAIVVAVTVHGDLEGRAPVLRGGARAGDLVAHSGVRGVSAAGLALLGRFGAGTSWTAPEDLDALVRGYLAPDPPLGDGLRASVAGATAMLDVSDGLLRDAGRLARASGVVLDLASAAFAQDAARLAPAARLLEPDDERAARDLVAEWVLGGGEDHGLLATFPPAVARPGLPGSGLPGSGLPGSGLPGGFRVVGRVLPPGGDDDVLVDGAVPSVGPGWDHFASGPR